MTDMRNRTQVFLFLDARGGTEFALYGEVFTPSNPTLESPDEYVQLTSGATEDVLRAEFGDDVYVDTLLAPEDISAAREYVSSPETSMRVRNI